MPEFDVTITYRLELTASITVKAKDEEAAGEKVQQMIDDEKAGYIDWSIKNAKGAFKGLELDEQINDVEYEV